MLNIKTVPTAEEIKAWRQAQVMTQGELAAVLEVEPMTISRWERGIHRPRNKALSKRLAALMAEAK